MAYQAVFTRCELKYILTSEQREAVLTAMDPHMIPDEFCHSTVRNIYFDTDNYRLIRRSIEKPVYKEKLRLRSYSRANRHSGVFIELKKKYKGIVYKRRMTLCEGDATDWLEGKMPCRSDSQIAREIDYFRSYYAPLRPVCFLSYHRVAYTARDGTPFRVTFDDRILARTDDLSLESEVYGTPLLEEGKVLMELKCTGGIPLWMVEILSRHKLRKTSFSKYGTAYQTLIYPQLKGTAPYV